MFFVAHLFFICRKRLPGPRRQPNRVDPTKTSPGPSARVSGPWEVTYRLSRKAGSRDFFYWFLLLSFIMMPHVPRQSHGRNNQIRPPAQSLPKTKQGFRVTPVTPCASNANRVVARMFLE